MINVEEFNREGIVSPVGQIDVTGYVGQYIEFQERSRRLRGKETYIKPHLVSVWLDDLVREPVIVDAVEQLIGPDIVLWESDWSAKRAGTGDYVPWHRIRRINTSGRFPLNRRLDMLFRCLGSLGRYVPESPITSRNVATAGRMSFSRMKTVGAISRG